MIFITTPESTQSCLSLQPIFFYYHLVFHEEKQQQKQLQEITPFRMVVLRESLEIWLSLESGLCSGLVSYELQEHAEDSVFSRFLSFFIQGVGAYLLILDPEGACSTCSHLFRCGMCKAWKGLLSRGDKFGIFSNGSSVFRAIKGPCSLASNNNNNSNNHNNNKGVLASRRS